MHDFCLNYYKSFIEQLDEFETLELGSICKINAGGDRPKSLSDNSQIYKVPVYSNGIENKGLYGYTNVAKIFDKAVTVSARGTIGFTCLRLEPFYPIVRLISLVPIDERVSAEFLYLSILNMNILSTGTTQQQLTVPNFKKEKIRIPISLDCCEKFQQVIEPIYRKIYDNERSNQTLSELRDTLLPKLMNGEIDLDNIEI